MPPLGGWLYNHLFDIIWTKAKLCKSLRVNLAHIRCYKKSLLLVLQIQFLMQLIPQLVSNCGSLSFRSMHDGQPLWWSILIASILINHLIHTLFVIQRPVVHGLLGNKFALVKICPADCNLIRITNYGPIFIGSEQLECLLDQSTLSSRDSVLQLEISHGWSGLAAQHLASVCRGYLTAFLRKWTRLIEAEDKVQFNWFERS